MRRKTFSSAEEFLASESVGDTNCLVLGVAMPGLPGDDSTELHGVRPRATDPVAAGRLWQLSEQLTGVSID